MTHRMWCGPQRPFGATITLMGDLELVARVDNRLLLRDATGAEYRLPICPKLKSAVYAAQSSPQYAPITGQNLAVSRPASAPPTPTSALQNPNPAVVEAAQTTVSEEASVAAKLTVVKTPTGEPNPRLRPAELQIRLRAGDSPEQLAEFSDLTVEQITRFAGPIEAERAEIIRAMRRLRVSTASPAGTGNASATAAPSVGSRTVGDLVTQRLGARGITGDQLTWHARRDLGAPWLIELKYEEGGRSHSARWTFEPARNQLTALDDEARWLTTLEAPATDTIPITLHQSKRASAGVGDPAAPLVSGAPLPMPRHPATAHRAEQSTQVGSPNQRPELRPISGTTPVAAPVAPSEAEPVAGIVPISRWQAEKLETVAMPITHPRGITESPEGSANHPAHPGKADPVADRLDAALAAPTRSAPIDATPTGSHPSLRKSGRSKIPRWDDIVFGSKES